MSSIVPVPTRRTMEEGGGVRGTPITVVPKPKPTSLLPTSASSVQVRTDDVLRIILDTLVSLGYDDSARALQSESGVRLEPEGAGMVEEEAGRAPAGTHPRTATALREAILAGRWLSVLRTLTSAPHHGGMVLRSPGEAAVLTAAVLRQAVVEAVERGAVGAALITLRSLSRFAAAIRGVPQARGDGGWAPRFAATPRFPHLVAGRPQHGAAAGGTWNPAAAGHHAHAAMPVASFGTVDGHLSKVAGRACTDWWMAPQPAIPSPPAPLLASSPITSSSHATLPSVPRAAATAALNRRAFDAAFPWFHGQRASAASAVCNPPPGPPCCQGGAPGSHGPGQGHVAPPAPTSHQDDSDDDMGAHGGQDADEGAMGRAVGHGLGGGERHAVELPSPHDHRTAPAPPPAAVLSAYLPPLGSHEFGVGGVGLLAAHLKWYQAERPLLHAHAGGGGGRERSATSTSGEGDGQGDVDEGDAPSAPSAKRSRSAHSTASHQGDGEGVGMCAGGGGVAHVLHVPMELEGVDDGEGGVVTLDVTALVTGWHEGGWRGGVLEIGWREDAMCAPGAKAGGDRHPVATLFHPATMHALAMLLLVSPSKAAVSVAMSGQGSGQVGVEGRQDVVHMLQRRLPPDAVPPLRLAALLGQAVSYQRMACAHHTGGGMVEGQGALADLLADHVCRPAALPRHPWAVGRVSDAEVWGVRWHDGAAGIRLACWDNAGGVSVWRVPVLPSPHALSGGSSIKRPKPKLLTQSMRWVVGDHLAALPSTSLDPATVAALCPGAVYTHHVTAVTWVTVIDSAGIPASCLLTVGDRSSAAWLWLVDEATATPSAPHLIAAFDTEHAGGLVGVAVLPTASRGGVVPSPASFVVGGVDGGVWLFAIPATVLDGFRRGQASARAGNGTQPPTAVAMGSPSMVWTTPPLRSLGVGGTGEAEHPILVIALTQRGTLQLINVTNPRAPMLEQDVSGLGHRPVMVMADGAAHTAVIAYQSTPPQPQGIDRRGARVIMPPPLAPTASGARSTVTTTSASSASSGPAGQATGGGSGGGGGAAAPYLQPWPGLAPVTNYLAMAPPLPEAGGSGSGLPMDPPPPTAHTTVSPVLGGGRGGVTSAACLVVWDLATATPTTTLTGHVNTRYALEACFDASGGGVAGVASASGLVCQGSEDGAIYLWHAWRGTVAGVLRGHLAAVNGVAWHATHPSVFASGSDDGTVCVWGP